MPAKSYLDVFRACGAAIARLIGRQQPSVTIHVQTINITSGDKRDRALVRGPKGQTSVPTPAQEVCPHAGAIESVKGEGSNTAPGPNGTSHRD